MMYLQCFLFVCFVGIAVADNLIFLDDGNDIEITPRITNAPKAKAGQFPWHVLLSVQYNDTEKINYCGGAILNEYWIITMADCVQKARRIRADIGSTNVKTPVLTVYPYAIVIHGKFNQQYFTNNIALVRMQEDYPLQFPRGPGKPAFGPIQLPRLAQRNDKFVSDKAFFTSFGYTSSKAGNVSERLLYAEQEVISNQECLSHYGQDQELISEEVVCTKPLMSGQGACFLDGGAPLAINESGKWTLIGILSFIHGKASCGQQPVPTAFYRITHHFNWIASVSKYKFRP